MQTLYIDLFKGTKSVYCRKKQHTRMYFYWVIYESPASVRPDCRSICTAIQRKYGTWFFQVKKAKFVDPTASYLWTSYWFSHRTTSHEKLRKLKWIKPGARLRVIVRVIFFLVRTPESHSPGSMAVWEWWYSQGCAEALPEMCPIKTIFFWAISQSSGFDDGLYKCSVRSWGVLWETGAFWNGC